MTAYARTLLEQPRSENYGAVDTLILATFGSLEARLVKSPEELAEMPPASATTGIKTIKDDWFILVSEKSESNKIVAICSMTMTMNDHKAGRLHANGFDDGFEVVGDEKEAVFLTVAPFEFIGNDKLHRIQGVLWQSIVRFCVLQNVDYIIGSLAFDSRYPAAHAQELSYLYHFCRPHSGLQLRANHGVTMDIMPEEAVKPAEAFSALPPMLRYFLRMGAKAGENAVVDNINNETRIFLLFSTKTLNS